MAEDGDFREDDKGPKNDEEPPRKQARRATDDGAFEQLYLDALPCADMYERSYMHRDVVTHIVVASTGFVITASRDGQVKFWKKGAQGIEFVKNFRAHLASINALAASSDGTALATTSDDSSIKVFDILGFDMVSWIKTAFVPGAAEFVSPSGSTRMLLAVADRQSPRIWLYNTNKPADCPPAAVVNVHKSKVLLIRYNAPLDAVVSADAKGLIEYWSADLDGAVGGDRDDDADAAADGDGAGGDNGARQPPVAEARLPASAQFAFKSETDLYALAKEKAVALSLAFSPDGSSFVTTSTDWKVRVWHFPSGKLSRVYDESLQALQAAQKAGSGPNGGALDAFDFGRRLAVEKELRGLEPELMPPSNAVFDASGTLLIYPSLLGVKVVALASNRLLRVLGKVESSERFVSIALHQDRRDGRARALTGGASAAPVAAAAGGGDPTLFAGAFKRGRFFLLTRREPEEPEDEMAAGRDVFNEKPTRDELALTSSHAPKAGAAGGGAAAIISTSLGEVHLKLFGSECPRTVENFVTHARNGCAPCARRGLCSARALAVRCACAALVAASPAAWPPPCRHLCRFGRLHASGLCPELCAPAFLRLHALAVPSPASAMLPRAGPPAALTRRYYDGVLFHRVIKGFMLQTGDPLGDGTGGTSIWGHEFEVRRRSAAQRRPGWRGRAHAVSQRALRRCTLPWPRVAACCRLCPLTSPCQTSACSPGACDPRRSPLHSARSHGASFSCRTSSTARCGTTGRSRSRWPTRARTQTARNSSSRQCRRRGSTTSTRSSGAW